MKKIFLTGATGVMGMEGMKEILNYPEDYQLTVLARPSKKNKRKLKKYIDKGVRVIWGDLLDKKSIEEGVKDADIVLHVGGMVSPAADWYPEKTIRTNIGAMQNIVDSVKEMNPDAKVVYIGSVAQYGNYEVPYHWGECGDILSPARFDAYAYSKVQAERILANSGLKNWVSLRQTGILHAGLLMKASDPIAFHVPIRGVLEWVTAEDSGRLLERVCRDDVPESFWNRFYNIGGGEKYRMTNYEFEKELLKAMGCPPPEKIFETQWFATQNFHGCWYKDSDELEDILHFRSEMGPKEYFKVMKSRLPWYFSMAPLAPASIIKMVMGKVAETKGLGPMRWIKENNEERIDAAFGSIEGWENIPGWDRLDVSRPNDVCPPTDYTRKMDLKSVTGIVKERGGEISEDMEEVFDPEQPMELTCCLGHKFRLNAKSLVLGGHWCPECMKINMKV